MGADRIGICPKCIKDSQALAQELKKSPIVMSSPGNKRVLKTLLDEEKCRTFAEYYGVGIYDGKFKVRYQGECSECGFKYSFDVEKQFEIV
jgi:hypothetical protein